MAITSVIRFLSTNIKYCTVFLISHFEIYKHIDISRAVPSTCAKCAAHTGTREKEARLIVIKINSFNFMDEEKRCEPFESG